MADVPTPDQYFSLCQLKDNQYASTCTATALTCTPVDKNHPIQPILKANPTLYNAKEHNLYSIVFNQTVLFSQGGGQASCQGTLQVLNGSTITHNFPIIGVFRIENIINHVVAVSKNIKNFEEIIGISVPETALQCRLTADLSRRVYNMYNHTTQHLLSAIMSQCFSLPTHGWTCGTYNKTLLDPASTRSALNYDELQSLFSAIDFSGLVSFDLANIVTFILKSVDTATLPLDFFKLRLLSIFQESPLINMDILQNVIFSEVNSYVDFSIPSVLSSLSSAVVGGSPLFGLDLASNPHNITFERLCALCELIAVFIMNHNSNPVSVQIDGVIDAAPAPEQSTTSMGVTSSKIIADGENENEMVLRENKNKYAKYGQHGAVPKRYINIGGVELSPCCGTHVGTLNELQSVQIISTQKYGAGRWRLFFVTHHVSIMLKNWYSALNDALKVKLCCQSQQILQYVDKSLQTASSIKFYNKKIVDLIVKDIMSIYAANIDKLSQSEAILMYNDAFFTTNGDLEQIAWSFSEQFKLKYPESTTRPLLFLTTCPVIAISSDDPAAAEAALFYVYGPSSTDKALCEFVKNVGLFFATALKSKGGGRPGSYQGKVLAAATPEVVEAFNKVRGEMKEKYNIVSNINIE